MESHHFYLFFTKTILTAISYNNWVIQGLSLSTGTTHYNNSISSFLVIGPQLYFAYWFKIHPKGLSLGTNGVVPIFISSRATKHKKHKQISIPKGQADSIMNECKQKQTNRFPSQAEFTIPISSRAPQSNAKPTGFSLKEKSELRRENVPGSTHWSHFPWCMEPDDSHRSTPCFNCQAGAASGNSERKILRQVFLAAATALPENSPTRTSGDKQQDSWVA